MIRHRLEYLETDFGLMETLCQAVTEWFDHEKVDIDKHSVKYHRALITQNNIGWRHIFMGRISQEWLKTQASNMPTNGTRREAYIWGASIVVSITSFIELWEQRNEEVLYTGKKPKHKNKTEDLKN